MASKVLPELQFYRFMGLSLSGGKSDKDALSVVDYYPAAGKVFLTHLFSRLKSSQYQLADDKLIENIKSQAEGCVSLHWDVPLSLPKCLNCTLHCPGAEKCKVPSVVWLRNHYNDKNIKKKPKKYPTPYTERCMEFYVNHYLEEPFEWSHACGSNLAPLSLRARFLRKQLEGFTHYENYVPLTLWRIGRSLGIQKSHLRRYKHAVEGVDLRALILEKLSEANVAFLYLQDFKQMSKDRAAFESFISALCGYIQYKGLVEKRPKTFPKSESWISFPREDCF